MLYTMPRYFRVWFRSFSFEEKTFFSTVLIYEMYSSDISYSFNSLIGISCKEKGDMSIKMKNSAEIILYRIPHKSKGL